MSFDRFWQEIDTLVTACSLIIDRPKGSRHPRYPEMIYPYDYGYLEGTQAADGGGIDCWVGSLPDRTVSAVICAIDRHKRDAEIKLLLGCTPAEAQEILAAHNQGSQSALLVERPPMPG
jgi:inorganic pyrophosphatase